MMAVHVILERDESSFVASGSVASKLFAKFGGHGWIFFWESHSRQLLECRERWGLELRQAVYVLERSGKIFDGVRPVGEDVE